LRSVCLNGGKRSMYSLVMYEPFVMTVSPSVGYLSEPQKAQEHLKKFVKIVREDARIRGNLLKLVTPGCSCKKAEDYVVHCILLLLKIVILLIILLLKIVILLIILLLKIVIFLIILLLKIVILLIILLLKLILGR